MSKEPRAEVTFVSPSPEFEVDVEFELPDGRKLTPEQAAEEFPAAEAAPLLEDHPPEDEESG